MLFIKYNQKDLTGEMNRAGVECLPVIKIIFKALFHGPLNMMQLHFKASYADTYQLPATCNHQALDPDHHSPKLLGVGVLQRRPCPAPLPHQTFPSQVLSSFDYNSHTDP